MTHMSAVTLKAHFDGLHICLDEPFAIKPNTPLLVTVLADASINSDRQSWLAASQEGLASAYGEDEPDYSDAVLREEPPAP